jgi:ABC-type sugar transport system substrate-binding protein
MGPSFHAKQDLKGKTLYFIGVGLEYPFVIQVDDGIKAAAAIFGMKVVAEDAQASSVVAARQISQAVSQGAAAIVVEGIDAGALHSAIAQAAAAHIPVVIGGDADTGGPSGDEPKGVFGNASASYYNAGQMMAEIAVAKLGTVHAVFITSSDQTNSAPEYSGFTTELKTLCSACTVTSTNVPESAWATGVGPATTTAISNPTVNVLAILFDAELPLALPSIRSAGASSRVKVVSYNATLPGLQSLAQGNPVIGDPGASNIWDGWQLFDQVLRALNGLPPAPGELPNRAFLPATAQTLSLTNSASLGTSWFMNGDIKTFYMQEWGLSS